MNVEAGNVEGMGGDEKGEKVTYADIRRKCDELMMRNKKDADALRVFLDSPDSPEKQAQMPRILEEIGKLRKEQEEIMGIMDTVIGNTEQFITDISKLSQDNLRMLK